MLPERMSKCRIIAPRSSQSVIINTLYDSGICHIKPYENDELETGIPLNQAEEFSQALVKIRSVLARFEKIQYKKIPILDKNWPKIKKGVEKLYQDFIQAEELGKELDEKSKILNEELKILKIINSFSVSVREIEKSKILNYQFGKLKEDAKITQSHERSGEYVLIVDTKQIEIPNFSAVIIPQGTDEQKIKDIEKIRKQESDLQVKYNRIAKAVPTLAALEKQISEEIKKQELPLSFAVTKSSFLAEGWIPTNKAKEIDNILQRVTKGEIHLEITNAGKNDAPPIKLQNKKLVTPFEFLLRLYDLPKYKEIDPTSLIFFTFPIFFGFMLGDVGYGIVLLIAFYFLKKKVPAAAQLGSILMFAALMSILFGFVFGEYFGFEHVSLETGEAWCNLGLCLPQHTIHSHGLDYTIADFPRLLNRAHGSMNVLGFDILSVLVIGAIVGFIHVNMALIFGFINELYGHGLKHAIMAKLSWIIMEIGIALFVMAKLGLLSSMLGWIGVAIIVVGIALLAKGEGIQGVVEIPALFSNILSYMRLGAVGLASVGLAVVVNENLGMPFIEKGGIFVFVGILIMILGHAINILLGIIGPFLHGIRLHYVEFFSKFFVGGGEEYKPFGKDIEEDH